MENNSVNPLEFHGYIAGAKSFNDFRDKHFAGFVERESDYVKTALILGESKEQVSERANEICLAVNSFPALVDALKMALNELSAYIGSDNEANEADYNNLTQIENALALAESK